METRRDRYETSQSCLPASASPLKKGFRKPIYKATAAINEGDGVNQLRSKIGRPAAEVKTAQVSG